MIKKLKTLRQEEFMIELLFNCKIDLKFYKKIFLIWNSLQTSEECGLFIENFLKVLNHSKTIQSFDEYLMVLMIRKQIKEIENENKIYLIKKVIDDTTNYKI